MKTLKVISVALLMVGCADPIWWTKPGFDMQTFRADDYACAKEANETRWGTVVLLYRQCMEVRGYHEGVAAR